jgi:hypothetical protein
MFFRDRSLNAINYFDRFDTFGNPVALDKPPFRQEQWGGTAGGPVRKDKTFFFLSYEGVNVTDARLVSIDPAAAALLNGQGFPIQSGNVPFDVRNGEALGKIDHQWTPARALALRANYADINREGTHLIVCLAQERHVESRSRTSGGGISSRKVLRPGGQ